MWAYKRNTLEPFKGCQDDPMGVLEVFRGPKLNPLNIVHIWGTFSCFYPQMYHYDDQLEF